MKLRHSIANFPLVGRWIYPTLNKKALFTKPGKYYPFAYNTPMDQFSNPKVVVFGLPKSGNTWMVSLLSSCLVMDPIHVDIEKNKSGVGMSHEPLSYKMKLRKDFARGVYIMRDLRDILVSYFHYVKTNYYKELNDPYVSEPTIESFYQNYFLSKLIHRYDWLNHATKYTNHGIPVIRYEDLFDNPTDELSRLFTKMGISVELDIIKSSIEENDISKLKASGKNIGKEVPATHFRKGGYGSYKNEMTEKLIHRVNRDFGDYLSRWGYELS